MAKRIYELTESQRCTITNGLRVAAEKFKQNAGDLRNGDYDCVGGIPISGDAILPDDPGRRTAIGRLAAQFDRQLIESRELARIIDDCDMIVVHEETGIEG